MKLSKLRGLTGIVLTFAEDLFIGDIPINEETKFYDHIVQEGDQTVFTFSDVRSRLPALSKYVGGISARVYVKKISEKKFKISGVLFNLRKAWVWDVNDPAQQHKPLGGKISKEREQILKQYLAQKLKDGAYDTRDCLTAGKPEHIHNVFSYIKGKLSEADSEVSDTPVSSPEQQESPVKPGLSASMADQFSDIPSELDPSFRSKYSKESEPVRVEPYAAQQRKYEQEFDDVAGPINAPNVAQDQDDLLDKGEQPTADEPAADEPTADEIAASEPTIEPADEIADPVDMPSMASQDDDITPEQPELADKLQTALQEPPQLEPEQPKELSPQEFNNITLELMRAKREQNKEKAEELNRTLLLHNIAKTDRRQKEDIDRKQRQINSKEPIGPFISMEDDVLAKLREAGFKDYESDGVIWTDYHLILDQRRPRTVSDKVSYDFKGYSLLLDMGKISIRRKEFEESIRGTKTLTYESDNAYIVNIDAVDTQTSRIFKDFEVFKGDSNQLFRFLKDVLGLKIAGISSDSIQKDLADKPLNLSDRIDSALAQPEPKDETGGFWDEPAQDISEPTPLPPETPAMPEPPETPIVPEPPETPAPVAAAAPIAPKPRPAAAAPIAPKPRPAAAPAARPPAARPPAEPATPVAAAGLEKISKLTGKTKAKSQDGAEDPIKTLKQKFAEAPFSPADRIKLNILDNAAPTENPNIYEAEYKDTYGYEKYLVGIKKINEWAKANLNIDRDIFTIVKSKPSRNDEDAGEKGKVKIYLP
jgi:hypothetical protein